MIGLATRFRVAFLVAGLALLLMAASPGNVATVRAQDGCDDLLEEAREAGRQRGGFDVDALREARDCLLGSYDDRFEGHGDEWRRSDDVWRGPRDRGTFDGFWWQNDSDEVLVSFDVDNFICLDFNADRTITSDDDTFTVTGGGYVGFPAWFSAFAYSGTFYLGGFSAWGITVGPFLLQTTNLGGVQTGEGVDGC